MTTSPIQLREAAERADLIERLTRNADDLSRRGTDDKGRQTTRARVDDLHALLDRLEASEEILRAVSDSRVEWKARALSAEAQRDEALAALEPFARFADALEPAPGEPNTDFLDTVPDDGQLDYGIAADGEGRELKYGDFRRAASLLTRIGKGEGK